MHNSQEIANAIKGLAKMRKIMIGKMLSDCNLSINTLSSMQSGGYYPRLEAIAKIADYLDCSVDYLLGRTDTPVLIRKKNIITFNNEVFVAAESGNIHTAENEETPPKARDIIDNMND